MRVGIATDSAEKIRGIKSAFSRFFKIDDTEIEFFHQKVNSGVSKQPFNEETYEGAFNRVNTLIEKSESSNKYFWASKDGGYITAIFKNKDNKCFYFYGYGDVR